AHSTAKPPSPRTLSIAFIMSASWRQWQRQPEMSALLAFHHLYTASVAAQIFFDDSQAETMTWHVRLAGMLTLVKTFKNPLRLPRFNAGPLILDVELRKRFLLFQLQGDFALFRRKLDRVHQQIIDHH